MVEAGYTSLKSRDFSVLSKNPAVLVLYIYARILRNEICSGFHSSASASSNLTALTFFKKIQHSSAFVTQANAHLVERKSPLLSI